ncbi:MAG: acyl-CoA dehydrogenase family protein [Caulobacterales bacterium]|jgi:alkylation response protein AidB-like acyl-CoA dehydrogenase
MFALTEEHTLLQEAARGFVQDRMPTAHLRALRTRGETAGFDRALWQETAAMGWAGVLIPETFGGAGLGYLGLGLILEEMGKTLAPSPLLGTALIGPSAVLRGGSNAQQENWLPKLAAGEVTAALAIDAGAHHDAKALAFTATAAGDQFRLNGHAPFSQEAQAADLLLVAANTPNGKRELFLIPATAPGVVRAHRSTVDALGAAAITLQDVTVGQDAHLAEGSADLLDGVLDCARIGVAAYLLGLSTAAFEMSAEYLKTRVQFGQAIGTFQGLQHRAAKMFVDLELTRSCVMAALAALDANDKPEKIAELASLAKARASDTAHVVTNETVQMHGGIGMTDAHDAGLYLKRARVLEALYGSASFHRDRYATLAGI